MNPMNEVVISKATINIGVGEAGEKLSRAMTLIENMTGQTPVKTYSKVTNLNGVSEKDNLLHVK